MPLGLDPIHNTQNLTAKNKVSGFSLYLLIILLLAGFLAALPLIKIDISSQSRGMVRSTREPVPLATVVSGRIKEIHLQNNTTVQKGDTLLLLVQENLTVQQRLNDTLRNDYQELLGDLDRLLQGNSQNLKTATAQKSYADYKAQQRELQSQLKQANINEARNKKLYDKSVLARSEYEKYVYELQVAKDKLYSLTNGQQARWTTQKRDLQEQINRLHGDSGRLLAERQNYVLTAPISGTVEGFSGVQPGSFINPSTVLATISPSDDLIVENTIAPNDIGLIRVGQPVKFQLDAFNYNQWGLLEGEVIDIDQNITIQNNSPFFKVRCSLASKAIQLNNGYKTDISKGMTLTTRYFITRRSLFDLLFDKIDDWLNPKISP